MTELNNSPTTIDPYLNTAYWDGKEMGGDTAQPWPDAKDPKLLELGSAINFLSTYAEQGASQLALTRFEQGQTFDVNNFAIGTILLSALERMHRVDEHATPMSRFANHPLPDRRPGLADKEHDLSGHGYFYNTERWINVITGGDTGVCLIDMNKVQAGEPNKGKFLRCIRPGIRAYSVGETYNYSGDGFTNLIRVNELVVCMNGIKPRGKTIRGRLFGVGKLVAEN